MQPMDVKKIKYYDKIVPLFITGKLKPDSVIAQGTAPHTVGFVEGKDSVKFAKSPTQWMTMIPTIYNADTLGIRPDLVGRRSDEHTSELQSLMRISSAVFCLNKNTHIRYRTR